MKEIYPIWNCMFCGSELEEVDKEVCSSLDIYKYCSKCDKTFKETYVLEKIEVIER